VALSNSPIPEGGTTQTGGPERRLVAVAVIDVVGYTRLMEQDEQGTHARWMELSKNLIVPKVRAYRGQVIKSTGDGFLIEFRSAVEAVRWGLDLQSILATRESSESLLLRLAIHVADIIPDATDIFGGGVNVVSRLQAYAEPGRIVVSAAVHEQVRSVLEYDSRDLGSLPLKNIARPVQAFAIAPRSSVPRIRSIAQLSSREHSIAVLPMRRLGDGQVESYFVEGVVHDIVGTLAGLKELFVISSSSTIALTDTAADPVESGRSVNVRYVVSGTLARANDRLRITVQLTEVETRSIIWSGKYDISHGELFTTQDIIASKIAYALLPHLRQSELQRALQKRPDEMDAYDLVLQALYRLYRLHSGQFLSAHDLLKRAIERDSTYAPAYALLASWYMMRIGQGGTLDFAGDSIEALRYASEALDHDSSNPIALAIYGHTLSYLFMEYQRALDAFDRAIASSPSSALAWAYSSPTFSYLGEAQMAIQRAEYSLRLSPLDPYTYWIQTALTLAHYINGTFEEAVRWGRKTMAANPRFTANLRFLIASLVAIGRVDEARAIAKRQIELEPNFSVDVYMARYPLRDEAARQLFAERLIAAGLSR
jgi:adenylate cyclase